jgi:hypothetical protein
VPNLDRAKFVSKKALRAKERQKNIMTGKKCMVCSCFDSQKLIHLMSLVPNRTPRALGKAFAGKKYPNYT